MEIIVVFTSLCAGPVIGAPRAGLKRPPGVAEVDPHAGGRCRARLRPGCLPHHPSKTVVLPVLDDLPQRREGARDDVPDGVLVIGKRPERARFRCGRRCRVGPRELVDGEDLVLAVAAEVPLDDLAQKSQHLPCGRVSHDPVVGSGDFKWSFAPGNPRDFLGSTEWTVFFSAGRDDFFHRQ